MPYLYNKLKKFKKKDWMRILFSFLIVVLVFFLAKAALKAYLRYREVREEKIEIQKEIDYLQQQKKELEKKINHYADPEFLEKEARRKFNLQKEGEQAVVVLPSEDASSKETNQKSWFNRIKDFLKIK